MPVRVASVIMRGALQQVTMAPPPAPVPAPGASTNPPVRVTPSMVSGPLLKVAKIRSCPLASIVADAPGAASTIRFPVMSRSPVLRSKMLASESAGKSSSYLPVGSWIVSEPAKVPFGHPGASPLPDSLDSTASRSEQCAGSVLN